MIETERLSFRKYTFDDLPELIEQRSDPDVNRYLGGTEWQNPEALATRMQFYIDCYEKYGFGSCAMIWKPTGEAIGTAGLQPLGDTGEIEVGYSLIKRFWGKGIGTEAARGWLDFGFRTAGLGEIVAVAVEENLASRRVMEKAGMRFRGIETHYGGPRAVYVISSNEHLQEKN